MPATASTTEAPLTCTAVRADDIRWAVPGGVSTFQNSRCFIVQRSDGKLLSRDGVQPSSWDRKANAAMVAEFPPTHAGSPFTWIEAL